MKRLATGLFFLALAFAVTHCGDQGSSVSGGPGGSGAGSGGSEAGSGGSEAGPGGASDGGAGSASEAGSAGTSFEQGGASTTYGGAAGSEHDGGESAGGAAGSGVDGSIAGAGGQGEVFNPECAELWAAVTQSDAAAKACDPEQPAQCVIIEDAGICGCPIVVTDPDSEAATTHLLAIAALEAAGCHPCDSPCAGRPIGECFESPVGANCL